MTIDLAPSGLPVEDCLPALRRALADDGQAVLVAPPGAGKTTIVPLRLLDEAWLVGQRIVVLEPRRLATRAACRRMASLLNDHVGGTVGYATRDERRVGRDTRVEVVTEGILTRRLQADPSLPGVGLVVFDELHERNLQADLALALVLDARPALRPDLRLLAMSATLEAARVAALPGGAPVIESEGRAHEVTVRWLPRRRGDGLDEATISAVRRAVREEPGDVLVFLPGAADIRRVESALAGGALSDEIDVRPLFGALPAEAQDAALAPSPPGPRRVVLATDIAEDQPHRRGRAHRRRFRPGPDAGVRRPQRPDQAGHPPHLPGVGRTAGGPGRTHRSGRGLPPVVSARTRHPPAPCRPGDLERRPHQTGARTCGVGSWARQLSFLDPPPRRSVEEARSLLATLGAIGGDGRPTSLGRAMANVPLHPRLARMVIGARDMGAADAWIACLLAALLEDRDVLRGRPDDLPTDVAARVTLIADRDGCHPQADVGAVRGAARARP